MSDRPPGKWGEALVGAWWPSSPAEPEAGIDYWSAQQRLKTDEAATLDRLLRLVGSDNRGHTAEDLILRLRTGRNAMTGIASRCAAKSLASRLVTDAVNRLRQTLTGIAERDSQRIEDIVKGSLPSPAKLAAVNSVVIEANTAAAAAEVGATAAIVDATQQMFTGLNSGDDARQWLASHGAKLDSPAAKPLTAEEFAKTTGAGNDSKVPTDSTAPPANQALGTHTGTTGALPGHGTSEGSAPVATSGDSKDGDYTGSSQSNNNVTGASSAHTSTPGDGSISTTGKESIHMGTSSPSPTPSPTTDHPLPATPSATPTGPAPTSGLTTPATAPSPLPAPPTGPVPAAPATAAPPTSPLAGLTQPQSAATPLLPMAPADAGGYPAHPATAAPPAPLTPPPPLPVAGPVEASAAPPPAPAVAAPPSPVGLAGAGPAATFGAIGAPPGPPVAAPAAPGGALPAYGADLRPPATAAVTPTGGSPAAAPPPATAPASGDRLTHHTAAAAPPTAAPRTPVTPAGTAVASASAGATVGQAGKDLADRADLHRKLAVAARQAPMLAWAAGLRADEMTTVLVTDLASGWIPPTVTLPAGVRVLPPARRRAGANAADLLGPVVAAATHSPHAALPGPGPDDPPGSGERARRADPIGELRPTLLGAVRRRPGLARITQTVATALARHTGVDANEAGLFRQVCAATAAGVLSTYPDHTTAAVAEWMLLAALDALLDDRRQAANYHLAWHRAVTAGDGGV